MMKITYLHHSGFLVELAQCDLIFDYYQGPLPALTPGRPLLVFASHAHHDHYEPAIFALTQSQKVTAVLSRDIPEKKRPKQIPVIEVRLHQDYALPYGLKLSCLQSTDCGVAFLLETPEGTIYHAGDLNDWSWVGESEANNRQMRGNYRHEIGLLKEKAIRAAFVPLDPRQGEFYANGLAYFLKNVQAEAVFPMHYWEQPEIIDRFLLAYPQYREQIKYTEHYKEGNSYEL